MESRKFTFSAGFLIGMALLLLMLPLQWLLSAAIAAAVHEGCHYLAIWLLSRSKASMRLGTTGAKMALPVMSQGREVLCALAGPLGGLCLLLFARWIPRIAICGVMQSAFNLLPIYPLDGGRALQSGLSLLCSPPVCRSLCRWIAVICKILACSLAIYGSFWLHLGLFPILMASLLLIHGK